MQEHEEYRKKYLKEIRDAINGTDYLVEISDPDSAQKYVRGGSPSHSGTSPDFNLSPEERNEFLTRKPLSPRVSSPIKKSPSPLSSSSPVHSPKRKSLGSPITSPGTNDSGRKSSIPVRRSLNSPTALNNANNRFTKKDKETKDKNAENKDANDKDKENQEALDKQNENNQISKEDHHSEGDDEEFMQKLLDGEEDDHYGVNELQSQIGIGTGKYTDYILQINAGLFFSKISTKYSREIAHISQIPKSELRSIKAAGFSWIYFTSLPSSENLEEAHYHLNSCNMKLITDYINDDACAHLDGVYCDVTKLYLKQKYPNLICIGYSSPSFDYTFDANSYKKFDSIDAEGIKEYVEDVKHGQMSNDKHYQESSADYCECSLVLLYACLSTKENNAIKIDNTYNPEDIIIEEEEEEEEDIMEILHSDDEAEKKIGSGEYTNYLIQIHSTLFLTFLSNKYNKEISQISQVPRIEFRRIRKAGFNWVYFTNLPTSENLADAAERVHSCNMKMIIDYIDDNSCSYIDGVYCNLNQLYLKDKYPHLVCIGFSSIQFDFTFDNKSYKYIESYNSEGLTNYLNKLKSHQIDGTTQFPYSLTQKKGGPYAVLLLYNGKMLCDQLSNETETQRFAFEEEDEAALVHREEEPPVQQINDNQQYKEEDIIDLKDDPKWIATPQSMTFSNCVLEIHGPHYLAALSVKYSRNISKLSNIPNCELRNIKASGFDWIHFTNLTNTEDLEKAARRVHSCHMKIMIDYINEDSCAYVDGVYCSSTYLYLKGRYPKVIFIGNDSPNFDYVFDNTSFNFLRDVDQEGFQQYIATKRQNDILKYIHFTGASLDYNYRSANTAYAALLLLPGMRVYHSDIYMGSEFHERVLTVLKSPAVADGMFEFADVITETGMVAWRYTLGKQHVLVTLNFQDHFSTGYIKCLDAPASITDDGKIIVKELLTDTIYSRDPVEMKTKGLCVILYQYEMQVFTY